MDRDRDGWMDERERGRARVRVRERKRERERERVSVKERERERAHTHEFTRGARFARSPYGLRAPQGSTFAFIQGFGCNISLQTHPAADYRGPARQA